MCLYFQNIHTEYTTHFKVSIIAHRIKSVHQILHEDCYKNCNNLTDRSRGKERDGTMCQTIMCVFPNAYAVE